MISDKVFYGKRGYKYYIGYQCDDEVKPLCVMFYTVLGYAKSCGETNSMSFLIKDENSWKHGIKLAM